MNAAIFYDRIKVRASATASQSAAYLVDVKTATFVPEVRPYIDSLAASMRALETQKTRCYHLRHLIVYLRSNNIPWRTFATSEAEQHRFSDWLNNPYRALRSNVIQAKEKLTLKSALKRSSQRRIIHTTRMLITFWSKRPASKNTHLDGSRDPTFDTDCDIDEGCPLPPLIANEWNSPKTYSKDDFETMLSLCGHIRDRAFLCVEHEGGLRLGENLGLRMPDIDLHRRGVWVRSRHDNPNRATGKSRRERFVPLPDDVLDLIDDYIRIERYAVTDHDMLWVNLNSHVPGQVGTALKKSAIYALYRKFKRHMDRKTLHPHMSRHTYVTNLGSAGVDIGEISVRVGHSSTETTRRIYMHLDDSDFNAQYEQYAKKKYRKEGQSS